MRVGHSSYAPLEIPVLSGIWRQEWRLRQRDTEEWMAHHQLPPELQKRVRRFVQVKWFATRGVEEESILHALPSDIRRDVQHHLCLDLVKRVCYIVILSLFFPSFITVLVYISVW